MDKSSFLGKLFDFSFKEFITLQLIQLLFGLGVVFAAVVGLGSLFGGIASLKDDFGKGILGILLSPVFFILISLAVRLALEAIVATFRIAENTTILAENSKRNQ